MVSEETLAALDALVAQLRKVPWAEREGVTDQLLAAAREHNSDTVRQHLDGLRKGLPLELRWEIEEVLEALQPPPTPPPAPPEPEPEPPPADGRVRMSDLREVYADPRGTVIYVDKKTSKRWFLSQIHPQTGQPMMMELGPAEVEQVKLQLRGSPYWIPGRMPV